MNKTYYHYIVDLNERGIYKAHVEHAETGEVIFEISSENTSELRIIEDGYMKNTQDINGLKEFLESLCFVNEGDQIIYKG